MLQNFRLTHHWCSTKDAGKVLDGAKLKIEQDYADMLATAGILFGAMLNYEQDYYADMMAVVNQKYMKVSFTMLRLYIA